MISQTLLHFPKPLAFQTGKPVFPVQLLVGNVDVRLANFAGPKSWLIFFLLKANGAWLNDHPSTWLNDEEYLRMKNVISTISVVNYTAERGVKDIEDFANASKDSSQRDKIILVANYHRSCLPEFLKSEMENEI